MTKKNLLVAMALPLAFAACSSEDVLTETVELQGQYNVEKVNALFEMDKAGSRLATGWHSQLEAGKDMLGLAWLGTGTGDEADIAINGKAYQNHPLYTQAGGNLKPETSIYVGEYFTYYPYDTKTVAIGHVNFSVAKQPLTTVYNNIAANSIWISPKWTTVDVDGTNVDGEAGIAKTTSIYPRLFSNRVRLALEFKNHEIEQGNTSIESIQIGYLNNDEPESVISFQYSPSEEQTSEIPAQDYWANQDFTSVPVANKELGYITLKSEPYEVLPSAEGVGFFYNALPVNETVSRNTVVFLALNTTYGKVYIQKNLGSVAYTHTGNVENPYNEYPDGVSPISPLKNSFVKKLNKLGKLEIDVDFLTAVMNGMCVKNDAHLNKLLNYYQMYKKDDIRYNEYDYTENQGIVLNLHPTNGVFELSKENIELLKEINADKDMILLDWCTETEARSANKLVVTGGEEVPELSHVFLNPQHVYLSTETWTWNEENAKEMGNVTGITNEGVLNVGADMNYVSEGEEKNTFAIENKNVININAKIEANININNHDVMNVKDEAEFWAGNGYTLVNLAKSLEDFGTINNEGVLTVTEISQLKGQILNYGLINHLSSETNSDVKTYITSNQTEQASFVAKFNTESNMYGTIMLNNKFDDVSVSNQTQEGFIKYVWNAEEDAENEDNIYQTPISTYYTVKYNYLIVDRNIKFVENEDELKFLEVAAGKKVIIAAERTTKPEWRGIGFTGIILGKGAEANIQLKNRVKAEGAFVTEGIVRVGGEFDYTSLETYLGGSADDYKNIGKY